ncbi:MAG: Crp/Fnr family transcriptional regulator, partial [Thermoleophilia bacterium]|nr:Crp/Fnr family transcriptional regulator [Thermoleophilia bacterium]
LSAEMLRRFLVFVDLADDELSAISGISRLRTCGAGKRLFREGACAEHLFLLDEGRAAIKVRCPDGREEVLDEVGPGDVLGWSAVVAPYRYTASAWTETHCRLVEVDGAGLRALCERNHHLGYAVAKNISDVMARRYGRAMGGSGDLKLKDLRAFQGEEHLVWAEGDVVVT